MSILASPSSEAGGGVATLRRLGTGEPVRAVLVEDDFLVAEFPISQGSVRGIVVVFIAQ